jgi:hypothetical protein
MARNYVGAATAVAAHTTLSLAKYVRKPKKKKVLCFRDSNDYIAEGFSPEFGMKRYRREKTKLMR